MDQEDNYQQITPKMSGYLEKKERKTMISSYKRYWFVLDGTLLVYYRSKDEYTAISPCKGTITLGPTCHVKPCTSNNGVFQIESKTTTITLRADTMENQHKWMQAIILALNQKTEYKKLNHFRHSVGEMPKIPLDDPKNVFGAKKPLSAQTSFHSRGSQQSLIERLQKIGAKSYGGIFSKNLQTAFNLPNYQTQKLKSFSSESLPYLSRQKIPCSREDFNTCKKSVIYDTLDHCQDDTIFDNNGVKESPEAEEVIYERIPSTEDFAGNRTTMMTSNDIYWTSNKLEPDQEDSKYEYPDVNHNLPIKDDKDDDVYTDIEQVRATLALSNNKTEYMEIIDNIEDKTRNSSGSSQESCTSDKKKRFGFGKKVKKPPEEKHQDKKVRKSESFLQRVLNKKSKNKKNADDEAVMNETGEFSCDETVKKLSELQSMLLMEKAKLHMRHRRSSVNNTSEMDVNNLNNRESMLVCNDLYGDGCSAEVSASSNSTNLDLLPHPPTYPSLPLKNQSQINSSTSSLELTPSPIYINTPPRTHVEPPSNKQPPKVPPKRKKRQTEVNIENLEDILTDLSREQASNLGRLRVMEEEGDERESKDGKVKELIRRYSNISECEEVEMRKKRPPTSNLSSLTNPNELDKLLDELSRVTVAPIMIPGVTTSLINPDVSDKEMLKMVPARRRKDSDPDYDIPRPHRSLINLPKKDDNALEATRFFGPILKPSDLPGYAGRPITPPVDYSNLPSITPDSLEVECAKTNVTHDELHRFSYESHDYKRFNKSSHYNLDALENFNSDPNKLLMLKRYLPFDSPMNSFHLSHESRFVDSLEP